jgi:hypothetical protein
MHPNSFKFLVIQQPIASTLRLCQIATNAYSLLFPWPIFSLWSQQEGEGGYKPSNPIMHEILTTKH